MGRQRNSFPEQSISSTELNWSISRNAEQISNLTNNGTFLFDTIVAADCLFFREFHSDLLQTLCKLLSRAPNPLLNSNNNNGNSGGVAIFLQPRRDRSMDQFVALCENFNRNLVSNNDTDKIHSNYNCRFDIEIIEDYSPEVRTAVVINRIFE